MKWPVASLGDIFEIARGGSPRPIDAYITDDPDGLNWIMISDASEGSKHIEKTKKRIRKEGLQKSRMVKPGDFLLTNSMSFGKPYILKTSGCIHDGWLVLVKKLNNLDTDFFYHLLGSKAVYSEFERLAAGSTVKNLNIDLVRGVKVPLPPLDEQRRIAAILDKADAIRRKRQESIRLTEEFLRSTFLEMFGDPVTNPKGLKTGMLGDYCDMETGFAFKSEAFQNEGIKLCRGANVLPGEIEWSDVKFWSSEDQIAEKYVLLEGDIVLAMDRPWISSGLKVARVNNRDIPSYLVQRVARLRGIRGVSNEFIYFCIKHPSFTKHCKPKITETTVPHISPHDIRSHRILIPDLDQVGTFSRIANKVLQVETALHGHIHTSEALFNSLTHRAFRGEL